jgi:N4-gp56 family major capsid protein
MATTSYGVNDALAVKLWSKRMDVEALKDTHYSAYIGTTATSLAQEMTETKKGAGDQVTWGLRRLASGDGVSEGEILEGNEEAISRYSDSMVINELRHAIRVKNRGSIDAQRVPYDLREEAYETLKDWYADRKDECFFNALAGNTAQTDLKRTGFNATVAPSATKIIRPAAVANDESLSTTNPMTLSLIDRARNRARTAAVPMRPIKGLGRDVDYVCFVHPDQVLTLRTDAATAGNWFDLQKARLQGGEIMSNAIYTGAVGIYNRTLIVEADRVPRGVNSSTGAAVANSRRAIFCGAQALGVAYGKDGGKTKFKWKEELIDSSVVAKAANENRVNSGEALAA